MTRRKKLQSIQEIEDCGECAGTGRVYDEDDLESKRCVDCEGTGMRVIKGEEDV